jgi:hypothetical protein
MTNLVIEKVFDVEPTEAFFGELKVPPAPFGEGVASMRPVRSANFRRRPFPTYADPPVSSPRVEDDYTNAAAADELSEWKVSTEHLGSLRAAQPEMSDSLGHAFRKRAKGVKSLVSHDWKEQIPGRVLLDEDWRGLSLDGRLE